MPKAFRSRRMPDFIPLVSSAAIMGPGLSRPAKTGMTSEMMRSFALLCVDSARPIKQFPANSRGRDRVSHPEPKAQPPRKRSGKRTATG